MGSPSTHDELHGRRAAATRRRVVALLASVGVGISLTALAACFDRSTAPPPSLAPVPRHDFMGDADWGANNSPASGSYDGTIDPVFGGAPAGAALGPFVYPTFIVANVSGQVRQMPAALSGDNIVREAWSTNDAAFWGSMGFTSNGGTWWPIGASATLRVVAPITPFRNQAGGQPRGDALHCGYPGYALCWTWAGSAHFDFTRIHVDLTLAQSPDTTVWIGNSATFTAGMSQTTFPGNPYPVDLSALQWRWVSDSVPSDSVACQSFSGSTCTHAFTSSGTMYTAAYVNGEAQQQSMHVNVSVPTVTLVASPTTANEGDAVTFTGTISPAWASAGAGTWSWQREDGGIMASRTAITPRLSMSPSSTVSPRLTLTTDADSVWSEDGGQADAVPQTPTTSACTTPSLTCQTAVFQNGSMRLSVAFGSVIRTAEASVQIHYECRPIYHQGLRLDFFQAKSLRFGDFIDWAQLNPPLIFSELYGEKNGIPLGKYRPISGTDSRGYELTQFSYVVLTCKDWRSQNPDGSDWWRGSDVPLYAGHHSLHFLPPSVQ